MVVLFIAEDLCLRSGSTVRRSIEFIIAKERRKGKVQADKTGADPIVRMLGAFTRQGGRFCMPGHKGRAADLGLSWSWDITELPGTDNLLAPEGCIAQSQVLCAAEHRAAHAFYGVNGATGCLLAMLSYLSPGDEVIVARDFHRSVENALRLAGVRPAYVRVEQQLGEVPAAVRAEDIIAAMDAHPRARAVFFTYPNYYGVCADAERICSEAHARGMLALADGAHAAHLPYGEGLLPCDLGRVGADIWCVSFHKTLPALGQAAVLFASARVEPRRLKAAVNRFQTTSPSYLILASIGQARAQMAQDGRERLLALLRQNRRIAARLEEETRFRRVPTDDETKLIIDVSAGGMSGFAAAQALARAGVCVEGADARHLLLLTSVCDTPEDARQLCAALAALETREPLPREPRLILLGDAPAKDEAGAREELPFAASVGARAAQSVFAYPPGVPLVLAGQEIDGELASLLAQMAAAGYNLMGTRDGKISVLTQPREG